MIPTDLEQTIDTIAHFAGQWHLQIELARSRDVYEGTAHRADAEDFNARPIRDGRRDDDDDNSGSLRSSLPEPDGTVLGSAEPLAAHLSKIGPVLIGKAGPTIQPLPIAPARVPTDGGADASDGGGALRLVKPFAAHEEEADPRITVTYDETVEQRLLVNKQVNNLVDLDKLVINSQSPAAPDFVQLMKTLGDMLAKAEAAIPAHLTPPPGNAPEIVQFVVGHQKAAVAAEHASEHPDAPAVASTQQQPDTAASAPAEESVPLKVEDGLYVDGELQPVSTVHEVVKGPDKPVTELPTTEASVGLDAELGHNTAFNLAEIVDMNEAATTVIVHGDHMVSNMIMQVNIYKDTDQVEAAGPHLDHDEQKNTASNVAEFDKDAAFTGSIPKMFAGPKWQVDQLKGDFYDVKVTAQMNVVFDNDVIVQTTEDSFSRLVTGNTVQMNISSWADLANVYDVIIIGGDLHEANIILQKNLLIDDDVLRAVSAADDDEQASMLVSWKGNTLLNDATIQNYGADPTSGIPEDIARLEAALQARQSDLDPEFGWLVDGNPSDTFKVLYITGNYYDINIIAQVNVVADVDTAVQMMPDIKAPNEDGLEQSASTGGNVLVNTAAIVDVGPVAKLYVGGNSYEESILVQANIVAAENEADKLRFGDTETLVNEVIAFTDNDECGESGSSGHHGKDFAAHDDVIGSVLH